MAVQQISRLQHRRGLRIDLPSALNDAEFGWAQDTRELFIGNGVPFLGNTQILSEFTSASIPLYTYISHTGANAITGVDPFGDPSLPNTDSPTIRTYQQKFDDFVNLRDYGAVGDFINDDTGAFMRAMRDLYDETSGPVDARRNRVLYIPAGKYKVTQAIPLYPFCNLIGDGKGRTIIFLDYAGGVTPGIEDFKTGNDCVARTVDSQGLSALNIGMDSPQFFPQNIRVSGITFESNTPIDISGGAKTIGASIKEIVKLDLAKDVRFDDCEFKGLWTIAQSTINNIFEGSVGVLISRLGDLVNGSPFALSTIMKGYTFKGCTFRNVVHGFNVLDTISDVNVLDCDFIETNIPIKLGFLPTTHDVVAGTGTIPGPGAPELFRVSHSRFVDYEEIGFDVRSAGRGNISSYNHYTKPTHVVTGLVGATYTNGQTIIINGVIVTLSTGITVDNAVIDITSAAIVGISAANVGGALQITSSGSLILAEGSGTALADLGFTPVTLATPAIRFDESTDACVSIGDTFDNTDIFDCADRLINLRVQNRSVSNLNVVMNAQDLFQIPLGFCGDILIEGDLTVTGDLILGGSIINPNVPFAPFAGTVVASIPFTDGNVIHFEYGMNLSDTVYRAGFMKIVHDGDGTATIPTVITFDDTFTEVGGPPADLITMSAVIVDPNVEITVSTIGPVPLYNFLIRVMTV